MSNYNTDKFPDAYSAANALATPFISGLGANAYSYTPILDAAAMNSMFGLDSEVWAYGGPDIGLVMNTQPQAYQASVDCSGFAARVLDAVVPAQSTESAYANIVIQNGQLVNYKTAQHPQPFPSAEDYAVSVFDASNVLHYNDTRQHGATGIGQGTILLVADNAGVPLAFQFNKGYALLQISPISNTGNLPTSTLQTLAVGRCC